MGQGGVRAGGGPVNESRLYRGLDEFLGCRDAIFKHLQQRWGEWFGTGYDFLLYDVTSTYFEGGAEANPKAARGYSRDNRPDCKQVCVGLVVTREGLPIGYEVFTGNRADVTTVEDIVGLMEGKYGKANRVWVTDRGMVSEDNMEFLRGRKALYLVGTARGMLRNHEAELLDAEGWESIRSGLEVKMAASPDGAAERLVICRRWTRSTRWTLSCRTAPARRCASAPYPNRKAPCRTPSQAEPASTPNAEINRNVVQNN